MAPPTSFQGGSYVRGPGQEPELRWRDDRIAPTTGAFAGCAVANADLSHTMVPTAGDDWERLDEFARTYDGYAYWEHVSTLARRATAHWVREASLPETLDELRACLFYEQRRWHHFADVPRGRAEAYLWALAAAIHSLVARPEAGLTVLGRGGRVDRIGRTDHTDRLEATPDEDRRPATG